MTLDMQHLEKPLILLVDDMPANLHVLISALRADYRIKTVTCGETALELAKRPDRPDLILLDVKMPGMNGIEFIKKVRSDLANLRFMPILFLTTESQQSKRDEARAAGASGWLVKPVQPEQLLEVLKKLLP